MTKTGRDVGYGSPNGRQWQATPLPTRGRPSSHFSLISSRSWCVNLGLVLASVLFLRSVPSRPPLEKGHGTRGWRQSSPAMGAEEENGTNCRMRTTKKVLLRGAGPAAQRLVGKEEDARGLREGGRR